MYPSFINRFSILSSNRPIHTKLNKLLYPTLYKRTVYSDIFTIEYKANSSYACINCLYFCVICKYFNVGSGLLVNKLFVIYIKAHWSLKIIIKQITFIVYNDRYLHLELHVHLKLIGIHSTSETVQGLEVAEILAYQFCLLFLAWDFANIGYNRKVWANLS